ncbi:Nucleolar protein 16 [Kappamyces sp. JEL0680]|nr:Nucleolar protein 16 [Kappamyces sp. JEL0680]
MGNKKPHQRRQTKNPNRKVKRVAKHRLNISFAGVHPLVQANWDKKKTLKENYEALGLLSHLQGRAGGQEGDVALETKLKADLEEKQLSMAVSWKSIEELDQEKARKEAELVSVYGPPLEPDRPLDERIMFLGRKVNRKAPLPAAEEKETNPIIRQMEEEAANPRIMPRFQSEQETLIFSALVSKYNDDYQAMARDIKLNSYQLTAGQLKKKLTQRLLPTA